MNKVKASNQIKERRVIRSRAKLFGTSVRPRLSVFRSNRFTSVQLIDDENHKTLASATTKGLKTDSKVKQSEALGEMIAKAAKELKINSAIFDRGGNKYHGRVKAIAESARKEGLNI